MQFDRTGGKLAHFSCNMTVASPSPGHHGGEGSRRPTGRWRAYPLGITAAKGLAALPDAWRTFPRAHWPSRRSALPRRGHVSPRASRRRRAGRWHVSPRASRRRRGSSPYRTVVRLPTGSLAEHPPSPRLRRTRTLGPLSASACFFTGNNGGAGARCPTKLWCAYPRAHWPSILLPCYPWQEHSRNDDRAKLSPVGQLLPPKTTATPLRQPTDT